MTLARVMLTVSYGAMTLLFFFHPNHTVDPTWSLHAEVHLRQAMNWGAGLCMIGLVLTWRGLLAGRSWVWWTLLLNALLLFGGFAAPPLILASGPYSPFDVWGLSILVALQVFGLWTALRQESTRWVSGLVQNQPAAKRE